MQPSPQRDDSSSSSEEGAHAGESPRAAQLPGDAVHSEFMLPHAAKTEGLAAGLRRRQGRHEG